MFRNYFVIALRNMKRHKGYASITIVGLALGMACCLCIALWISDELKYDRFHADSGQLYQVIGNGSNWSTPIPLAPALKREFPEAMFASRYSGYGEPLLRRGEKVFYEGCVRLVDSDFFHIFSFPFIRGNPKTALADVHSIVISEVTAAKYFPGEDPLGKSITMNDERDLTVTGVMQNTPEHSTLEFDMAISYDIYIEEAKRNGQNPHS